MADSQPFKQETIYDRIDTVELGMNSGIDPLLLKRNELGFATNLTTRNGFATDRPPFFKRTVTYPSTAIQTAVEQGLFQGAAYYQPDSGDQSLFAAISGRLFQFVVQGDTITCTERTIPGDPNPALTTQAWLWQSENYLIWNDGASLPVFFDGTSSRRSNGPSVSLGVVNAAPIPVNVVAIGDQATFPLAANWTGSYEFPALYNGAYYQPVFNAGTFEVQLTSLFSNAGEAINVDDTILIKPVIAGVVGNTLVLPVGSFSYNSTFIDITLTSPYTGVLNPFLQFDFGKVILFGKVWFVSAASGNSIRVIPGQVGTFPASLVAGTQIQFTSSNAANVNLGAVQVTDVAPATGGTVQLTVNTAYTGTPNQIVYIGTGQYTIIGIPQAAPGAPSVTMINLSDTSTGAYPFLNTPVGATGEIISVPELPAGRMGTYGLAQNWISLVDGLSFIPSDISRGPSGTTANNRRDSVLKTTDLTFLGGAFSIPGAGNIITSMTFTANLDVALGQGSLQVGTANFMASCLAPIDFTNPPKNGPILTYSLIGTGPLAQDSTVLVNSDVYFRCSFGLGSLIMARRDFQSPGNTLISDEVRDRLFELDNQALLSYGSSIVFDNRFITTLSPQASSQGVLHAGLIVQNLDPVSGMRDKQPPVYDGLWTGINTLKLVTGSFNGVSRGFAFTFNTSLSKIELFELIKTGTDHFDNTNVPITWAFETAALFNADVKPRETMIRLLNGEFAVSEVIGLVRFEVYYKSDQNCWTPWHAFSICASTAGLPQYFPRLGLGEPSSADCDPILNTPTRDGFTFQFKFVITGHCKFLRARFAAMTLPINRFPRPQCDTVVSVSI